MKSSQNNPSSTSQVVRSILKKTPGSKVKKVHFADEVDAEEKRQRISSNPIAALAKIADRLGASLNDSKQDNRSSSLLQSTIPQQPMFSDDSDSSESEEKEQEKPHEAWLQSQAFINSLIMITDLDVYIEPLIKKDKDWVEENKRDHGIFFAAPNDNYFYLIESFARLHSLRITRQTVVASEDKHPKERIALSCAESRSDLLSLLNRLERSKSALIRLIEQYRSDRIDAHLAKAYPGYGAAKRF